MRNDTTMNTVLEIIKITLPALIVFGTVYVLMKHFFEEQQKIRLFKNHEKRKQAALPAQLTAYERLSLFCERISIPTMLMRVKQPNMQAKVLQLGLMMAAQQEYEHNITQQVYVSDNLWKIIQFAKDDVLNTINHVGENIDPNAPADDLAKALFAYLQEREVHPTEKALQAIKKEASLLFN